MAVIKPKEMPPFGVLSIFGQSYKKYKYNEQLFRLIMEIEFKWKAVLIAYELIDKQERIIQKERKDTTPRARSYDPEVKQIAYLGFLIDAVYALTERVSLVTRIFHDHQTSFRFERLKNLLISNHKINPQLSKLMIKQDWYDLFIELRTQHAHYGSAILSSGYDHKTSKNYSQLVIQQGGDIKNNKILKTPREKFDIRKTREIVEGLRTFIQDWSLVLLQKLDINATMFGVKDGLPLKKFMEGRKI